MDAPVALIVNGNVYVPYHVTLYREKKWGNKGGLISAAVQAIAESRQNPAHAQAFSYLNASSPNDIVSMFDGVRWVHTFTKKGHEGYLPNRKRKLDKVFFRRLM